MITPMTGDTIEQFCREYVRNGGNATAAYNHAKPGMRLDATARVQGCLMLKKPEVIAYLAELRAVARAKYEEVKAATDAEVKPKRKPKPQPKPNDEEIAEAEERGTEWAASEVLARDTAVDIALQFDELCAKAVEAGQFGPAVAAVAHKAKVLGVYVEKKDISIGMRPDEARQVVSALLSRFASKP